MACALFDAIRLIARGTWVACKATGFMTNDEYIAEAVDRHCFGRLLVAAILRALRQSMRAAGRGEAQGMMGRGRQLIIAAAEARPTLEEPELLSLPDNADGDREFRDRSWIAVEP